MIITDNQKISIDFNDSVMSVQGAKDGSKVLSKTDTTKDCIVQKEMDRSITYSKEQNKKPSALSSPEDNSVKKDFLPQALTGEDMAALDKDGTPLEEYNSEQFDRAVERIKKQRQETSDSIDHQVEKDRDIRQDQEERANILVAAGNQIPPEVVDQLASTNLPLTQENVERVAGAMTMAQGASDLTEGGQMQVVKGQDITPETIYQAAHISASSENGQVRLGSQNNADDMDFEQVSKQVSQRLLEAGMEASQENLEVAKKLYDNNMPVTVENIKKEKTLQDVGELDSLTLLNRILDSMVDGVSPEKADLTMISRQESAQAVSRFQNEGDYVKARRQLEESRLKLTIEAARQLSSQGIDIDTTNLQGVVEGLKKLEKQTYENLFKETGIDVSSEATNKVADTFSYVDLIKNAPSALIGATLEKGMDQTIPEFVKQGQELAKTFESLSQEYEKVGTEVRTDLGDSIKKAFQNVDHILQEMNLPVTQSNQRAVRILGYNQMDITQENVRKVKNLDSRVNTMLDKLSPPVVARMVQSGQNPLNMTMDEVTRVATDIAEDIRPEDISFSKFLWKLDKSGQISQEEKTSMIGVFRLLDKIEKSDGEAVGFLSNQDREVTLSSLLSAVRSKKAKGLDAEIDDSFGALEELDTRGESIDSQIGSAFAARQASLLKRVLAPDMFENQLDEPLEQLLQQNKEQVMEEKEFYQQQADAMRTSMQSDSNTEAFLSRLSIPDSAENRAMAKSYLEGMASSFRKHGDKEKVDEVIENFDNSEKREEAYKDLDEASASELQEEKATPDITYSLLKTVNFMSQRIRFFQKLRNREMYEIPIETDRGVTTLKVTIQKNSGNKGTAQITMQSDELGLLQASFTARDHKVSGFVTSEQQQTLQQAGEWMEEVKKNLTSQGFEVGEVAYAKGTREVPVGLAENSSDTKDLYQIAKTFVKAVSNYLERMNKNEN